MLDKDVRSVAGKDVAQNTAADSGDDRDEYYQKWVFDKSGVDGDLSSAQLRLKQVHLGAAELTWRAAFILFEFADKIADIVESDPRRALGYA